MTSGTHAHFQLSGTGKVAMPAAAITPPKIGKTDDACPLRMTVHQNTTALNAIITPPITRRTAEKISWGQIMSLSQNSGL